MTPHSATVREHLQELRKTIFFCLGSLLLGVVLAAFFYQPLINLIKKPLESTLNSTTLSEYPTNRTWVENKSDTPKQYTVHQDTFSIVSQSPSVQPTSSHTFILPPQAFLLIEFPQKKIELALFSPLAGLSVMLTTCLVAGFLFSAPCWSLFFIRFFLPALYPQERKLLTPFLIGSFLFLSLGVLAGYVFFLPFANQYLYHWNHFLGTNLWSAQSYFSYTLCLLLGSGIALELCFVLFLLVHHGLIEPKQMREKRRIVVVASFLLAALLTPPDIWSQFLFAGCFLISYESALLYGILRSKNNSMFHVEHDTN